MPSNAYPDDNMTQVEVARVLGVSPQRVGQIERAALTKIREAIQRGELPAFAEEQDGRLSWALRIEQKRLERIEQRRRGRERRGR